MLRPVIRGSNRLIGGSWFFRLRLHSLALPSPHQRSCRDAVVLGRPGSEPFALNQRSRRSERLKVFFRGRWGWAPATNDVFALSAEDRALPSELPCAATQESTTRRKPRRPRGSVTNRER